MFTLKLLIISYLTSFNASNNSENFQNAHLLMQIPSGYIHTSFLTDEHYLRSSQNSTQFIRPNIYNYIYPDSSTLSISFESGTLFLDEFNQDTLYQKLYKDYVFEQFYDSITHEAAIPDDPNRYQYLESDSLKCVNNTYYHSGYCYMDPNGDLPSYYYKIAFDCKQKLCRFSVSYKCKTFSQKIKFDIALRSIIWFQ